MNNLQLFPACYSKRKHRLFERKGEDQFHYLENHNKGEFSY